MINKKLIDKVARKPTSKLPYASKGDLVNGALDKHLVRLAVPMVWGIFAIISFQLVDIYFVSLLGTQQLAALSFTLPVSMVVFSIILGLVIAMSSVLSRQIGEGNHDKVVRITTHGLVFAFLFGLVLAGIGLLLLTPIFRIMGADDEMMPMIHDYMVIWFGGSVFLTMPLIGNAAIRATGNTLIPALIMSTVAIVNLILDPILIFGLFGFPRLELQGAAIATVFANACAMLAGLYVLYFHKKMISFRPFRFDLFGDSVKRLLFIALPAGLTNAIHPFINAIIISLLATYGAETVAAFGIVTRIEAFAMIALMGVASGMTPIIGQNWGAKRFDRVNETLHMAFKFSILWSIGIAFILIVFARPIAGLFSDDAAVIDTAIMYFWIVPVTYIAGNLIPGWAAAFNAIGNPKRSAIMIFTKYLFVQMPLAMIGGHLFGVVGIFSAIAITNIVIGSVLHIRNWKIFNDHNTA